MDRAVATVTYRLNIPSVRITMTIQMTAPISSPSATPRAAFRGGSSSSGLTRSSDMNFQRASGEEVASRYVQKLVTRRGWVAVGQCPGRFTFLDGDLVVLSRVAFRTAAEPSRVDMS
jgi:hypothetical protein